MMVLVRSSQMVQWRDRDLEMTCINAQRNTSLFWHSCRRRLFRRLCSELYSSTDNKRSGKTVSPACCQTSCLVLPFYDSLHPTCRLSLPPHLSLPCVHPLPFSFISCVCLWHTYLRTPVHSESLSLSLLPLILPAFLPFWVTETHKETDIQIKLLSLHLSLPLSFSLSVETVKLRREDSAWHRHANILHTHRDTGTGPL